MQFLGYEAGKNAYESGDYDQVSWDYAYEIAGYMTHNQFSNMIIHLVLLQIMCHLERVTLSQMIVGIMCVILEEIYFPVNEEVYWIKKICAILLILSLLILFCACDSADVSIEDNVPKETSSTYIVDSSDDFQNHDVVYYKEYGKLTKSSSCDEVLVCSKSGDSEYNTEVFLEASVGGDRYSYSLGQWDASVFKHGDLIVTDLNDDEVDEIVLHMEVTKNGGTLAQVFSVKNNAIA